MGISKNSAVAIQLRTLFNFGSIRELTDGQLLERFATESSEASELAFAVLVERHGPMVLRVCRSVLSSPHDSEDAFQATFLVLVKKARGLWIRDSLGPWLHQVAYRTASCTGLPPPGASGTNFESMRRDPRDVLRHTTTSKLCFKKRFTSFPSDIERRSFSAISRDALTSRRPGTWVVLSAPSKAGKRGLANVCGRVCAAVASLRRVPCSPARPFSQAQSPKSAPRSSLQRREPPRSRQCVEQQSKRQHLRLHKESV